MWPRDKKKKKIGAAPLANSRNSLNINRNDWEAWNRSYTHKVVIIQKKSHTHLSPLIVTRNFQKSDSQNMKGLYMSCSALSVYGLPHVVFPG